MITLISKTDHDFLNFSIFSFGFSLVIMLQKRQEVLVKTTGGFARNVKRFCSKQQEVFDKFSEKKNRKEGK